MRRLLLVVLLPAFTGCSVVLVRPAPEVVTPPEYPVDCTTSGVPQAIDTIIALAGVIGAGYYATRPNCDKTTDEACISGATKNAGVFASATAALLWGTSAAYGSRLTKRCKSIHADGRLCYTGREDACRRLDPAWTPAKRVVPAVVPPPAPQAGCTKDVDCKGSRICDRGTCVDPAGKRAR